MIPRLDPRQSVDPSVRDFLDVVARDGFRGTIRTDYATRLVHATDNSIYQLLPQAVVAPADADDVARLMTRLADTRFADVTLSPRGGGTGTNAQSLTRGIVVDLGRHMNRILELDPEHRRARVQPGVVLDQLNAAARPHGLMFAPTVSTSDRATLGGMIATDAAGQGSRVYGRTSRHVLSLTTVLHGGTVWTSMPLDDDALAAAQQRGDIVGRIHRVVDAVVTTHRGEIARVFPRLNRFMTGYNLAMVRDADGRFDLNPLLCGSEGTLGCTVEATLHLTPIPAHRTVVVVKYPSFDAALGSAALIAPSEPTAIETMDERLLDLVRTDEAYLPVASILDEGGGAAEVRAINLVEYAGDDAPTIDARVAALVASIDAMTGPDAPSGATVMRDAKQINAFWTLRKRSVGLLGNLPGRRKPVAFVEDTVVPPERLRDFVREFRAILDDAGFTYGMFGHVDVGCLHVRPALDLKDERDAGAVRRIGDAVARLVRRYGGIIWGEHGKGVRGEYNPMFFGDVIYGAMREVKAAFDPRGQLNPGKIATPTNSTATLLTIDTEMRGRFDRQITPALLERFDDAVRCNGNGQCHNDHADVVMCPSWKETRDRRHTPKGRAALMREWLRLLSNADATFDPDAPARGGFLRRRLNAWRREPDFSHEVLDAMRGCLACKACAGQCPVKVDVPDFRAEFLQAYHDRYPRPLRDRLVAGIESALPRAARVAGLANVLTHLAPARLVGLVDAPVLATPTLAARLRDDPARRYDVGALSANSVVIVPDAFSTFYTPQVVVALIAVIRALGFEAMLMPYFVNGKSMHVKGFTRRFRTIVRRNVPRLRAAAATGATLVGIDPAVTLTYRDEYRRALGADPGFRVLMVQEWLGEALAGRPARPVDAAPMRRLFMHCTERALTPTSMRQWADVCARLGAPVEVVDAGCCGMCGAYGHERDHVEQSRGIYARSWARHLGGSDLEHLATGYSCRSQVKRIDGVDLRHPIEVLADALRGEAS